MKKLIKINKLENFAKDVNKKITFVIEKELVTLIKSQNLIDVKTPSFINTKFIMKKQNNLVELNKRLEKIKDSDPETYNRIKSQYR